MNKSTNQPEHIKPILARIAKKIFPAPKCPRGCSMFPVRKTGVYKCERCGNTWVDEKNAS